MLNVFNAGVSTLAVAAILYIIIYASPEEAGLSKNSTANKASHAGDPMSTVF